jgi:hypothetical protein
MEKLFKKGNRKASKGAVIKNKFIAAYNQS